MFGVQGLGALLQAFTGSSDANVLSTPNLIPLDNEEAKINVGQNVPIATGSHSNLTSSSNRSAFNTYDRRDVGLTLHVKPQITEGGILKLRLYTEDSSVVNGTTDSTTNPAGPTFNERSIQSTVLADNGEIIRITYYYAKPRHRLRESKVIASAHAVRPSPSVGSTWLKSNTLCVNTHYRKSGYYLSDEVPKGFSRRPRDTVRKP